MKKHNFSAGPCILPQEVLQKASKAIINFNNNSLSLIEISHRSKPFVDVMKKTQNLVKELLNIPKGYSVLFLQGGASLEFLMTPLNLMKDKGKAAYINGIKRKLWGILSVINGLSFDIFESSDRYLFLNSDTVLLLMNSGPKDKLAPNLDT